MKKLLLFAILLFGITSCSREEEYPKYCECDARIRYEGQVTFDVIPDMELNCITGQPVNLPPNSTFLGCDNPDTP